LTPEDYLYCEELAKFYYDHGVIPRPSVSSLAKRAIIRIATEWMEVQSLALKIREERQNVMRLLNVGNNNIPRSAISQTRIPDHKIQPIQPTKHQLHDDISEYDDDVTDHF
jgi:hypothetical protein